MTGDSTAQFAERLESFALCQESVGLVSGLVKPKKVPKIGFLFTGMINETLELDRQLYEQAPIFRQVVDRCNAIAQPLLGKSLLNFFLTTATVGETPTDNTAFCTALFTLQIALYELWKSWGIEPSVVMGISLGEYAAACIAGIFSLEDAIKLLISGQEYFRSRIPKGAMVTVFADEERVAAAIKPYADKVVISVFAGPMVLISGEQQAVDAVVAVVEAEGVTTLWMNTSYALHSPFIESLQENFAQYVSDCTFSPPKIPIIPGVTGYLSGDAMTIMEYWRTMIQEPVRFSTGMQTMHQQGVTVFVEIGPKADLLPMGIRCLPEETGVWLPSLRFGQSNWQQLLSSLAELYVLGAPVNWWEFDRDYSRNRLQLPTYPFERQSYWLNSDLVSNHQGTTFSTSKQKSYLTNKPRGLDVLISEVITPESTISLTQEQLAAYPEKQQQLLEEYLTKQIAKVLGLAPSHLNVEQPINTLGLDSLMSIQLVKSVRKDLALELPREMMFKDINLIDLVHQLQTQLTSSF